MLSSRACRLPQGEVFYDAARQPLCRVSRGDLVPNPDRPFPVSGVACCSLVGGLTGVSTSLQVGRPSPGKISGRARERDVAHLRHTSDSAMDNRLINDGRPERAC
jgi:hypothetical protein